MISNSQRAIGLFNEGKIAAAKKLFESALLEEPGNLDNQYKLAVCEFRLKNFSTAQKSFQAITSKDPKHFEAWYYLGLCFERQGETETALLNYRFALAVNQDFAAARKKLGVSDNVDPQVEKAVFKTKKEEGPGERLYGPKRRRLSSFSLHLCLLFLWIAVSSVLTGWTTSLDLLWNLSLSPLGKLFFIFPLIIIFDLFLRAFFTTYILYERRIEIKSGILFREHASIWLFEITRVTYTRNPIQLLTRNASVGMETEKGNYTLVGMKSPSGRGGLRFSEILFEELRDAVRDQRGEVKKIWI